MSLIRDEALSAIRWRIFGETDIDVVSAAALDGLVEWLRSGLDAIRKAPDEVAVISLDSLLDALAE